MEHVQQEYAGSSIEKWEHDHYIVRYMRNGCEYVTCVNWQGFQQKCDEERTQRRNEYIARQQLAAHYGGEALNQSD